MVFKDEITSGLFQSCSCVSLHFTFLCFYYFFLSRTVCIQLTKRALTPGCSVQVYSDPYLLVQCGLVLLAQQVNLSPHSRSAIRDAGGGSSHPLSSTIRRLLSHTGRSGSTGAGKVIPYHPPPQPGYRETEPVANVTSWVKTSALQEKRPLKVPLLSSSFAQRVIQET